MEKSGGRNGSDVENPGATGSQHQAYHMLAPGGTAVVVVPTEGAEVVAGAVVVAVLERTRFDIVTDRIAVGCARAS